MLASFVYIRYICGMKEMYTAEDIRQIIKLADETAGLSDEERCGALLERLNRRGLLYVTSKAFRARLSEFCDACEAGSDVYITRPGGVILHLAKLGEADAEYIHNHLSPETELKTTR